jgi:hypothetical protein
MMRVRSFQKVWITPEKAVVYHDSKGSPAKIRKKFGVRKGQRFAYIVETDLSIKCECDLVAMKNNVGKAGDPETDFTIDVFKDIIIPEIHREVNTGANFARIRQIYHALILATWYRRYLRTDPAYEAIFRSVDSDNPDAFQMTVRRVQDLSPDKHGEKHWEIDHDNPGAPAFDVADNREFYQEYIRYFREGVFRCVRTEPGDEGGEMISRVYFSGSARFEGLGSIVQTSPAIPPSSRAMRKEQHSMVACRLAAQRVDVGSDSQCSAGCPSD